MTDEPCPECLQTPSEGHAAWCKTQEAWKDIPEIKALIDAAIDWYSAPYNATLEMINDTIAALCGAVEQFQSRFQV